MRLSLALGAFFLLSITSCIDGTSIGTPTVGSTNYYLSHSYVGEAKALGDQAFDRVRQGDGDGARALFNQSTEKLTEGVARHRMAVSDRAETQQMLATAGVMALAVAGGIAGGKAMSNAQTAGQFSAIEKSMQQMSSGLQNLMAGATEMIDDAQRSSISHQATSVDRDAWRAVVVSDDNIARSVVRIINNTKKSYCTGFFVSPHLIMTSAHCFQLSDAVSVYRQTPSDGRSLMRGEDEYIMATHLYALSGYDHSSKLCKPRDMALLLTKDPSPHFLPLSSEPPQEGETLMVVGYSGDLNKGFFLRLDYGCEVTRGVDGHNQFGHSCASYGGNSGGPVIRAAPGRIAVLGTHSCGPTGAAGSSRSANRTADSVVLAESMIDYIRGRPEAQGRLAGMPF